MKEYIPEIILSIQTFGDLLIWHPHLHYLVTNGVFDREKNWVRSGHHRKMTSNYFLWELNSISFPLLKVVDIVIPL